MIALVIALAFAVVPVHELAEGARADAPKYLTPTTALEHAMSATLAGIAFDVPPELLMSIAHHESRYEHRTITIEGNDLASCGVMTPVPIADHRTCALAVSSPLAGYLHGAKHLRRWLKATKGDMRTALLGYAGGYRMIRMCKLGPYIRTRGTRSIDLCRTPEVFTVRAARIARRPPRGNG